MCEGGRHRSHRQAETPGRTHELSRVGPQSSVATRRGPVSSHPALTAPELDPGENGPGQGVSPPETQL